MAENIRNATIAVGTSPVLVAPQLLEGQRTTIAITNTSTAGQIITLSWGEETIAGIGIVLSAYGSWSESVDAVFIPSNMNIWAVSSAIDGSISIQERIRS